MKIPNFFVRNEILIKERLEKQIEISLNKGNTSIDKALNGPLNGVLKPIIKMYYNNIARKNMEEGSRQQVEVTLEAAKLAVLDNKSVDEVANKYFAKYLAGDQTSRQLKKNHKNYRWIINNVKEIFKSQIKPLIELLKCNSQNNLNGESIQTYDELAIASFKTKDKARKALNAQFYLLDDGLKKLEEDPSIINIVAGQDILLKILRDGFQETWDELERDTNNLIFHK